MSWVDLRIWLFEESVEGSVVVVVALLQGKRRLRRDSLVLAMKTKGLRRGLPGSRRDWLNLKRLGILRRRGKIPDRLVVLAALV